MRSFFFPKSRRLKPAELFGVYRTLRKARGHQHWWPGRTPFEVIVGAILTQNTAWTNVEKAIRNLKHAYRLTPRALWEISRAELARLIRPAGYFNIKADRLKNFVRFLFATYGGKLDRMFREDGGRLREKLLAVKGIGPETADSILLYAAGKPFFVIDAYTRRIFSRHRLIAPQVLSRPGLLAMDYQAWQDLFAEALPREVPLYNDFHAQIVALGKQDFFQHRMKVLGDGHGQPAFFRVWLPARAWKTKSSVLRISLEVEIKIWGFRWLLLTASAMADSFNGSAMARKTCFSS